MSYFVVHGSRSRKESRRTQAALADHLGRAEPHSPTPDPIKRAVCVSRMELQELMAEIVREEPDLKRLISLLDSPCQ